MTVRNLLGAALLLLLPASSAGRTWRVRPDRSGDAPTIQAAIDSAASGDSVLIAAGLYDENLNTHGKGLTLRGVDGPEVTIIDGGGRGRVLSLDDGGVVERLTLRNGSDEDGGGIRMLGSGPAILRQNIIESNVASLAGGGMYFAGTVTADIVIESNIIRRNTAAGGGGLVLGNSNGGPPKVYVRSNIIDSNDGGERGGGILADGAKITENIITRNAAIYTGGGVDIAGGGSEISRNTIAFNNTENLTFNGAGILVIGAEIVVTNNLVVGNHSFAFTPRGEGISCNGIVPRCNLLWGNDVDLNGCTADPSNLNQDPQFCAVDPMGSMNFFIQADSPCAPAQSACGLIGAWPVGCGATDVPRRRWGDIKQLYR